MPRRIQGASWTVPSEQSCLERCGAIVRVRDGWGWLRPCSNGRNQCPTQCTPPYGTHTSWLGWIHLSDERAVEIFESELFSGQAGKGTGTNKAFHSQFLFKGNLGYLEPKQNRSLWKVGFFGGTGCFTNGPHPKIYKNARWDPPFCSWQFQGKKGNESRENPPRLGLQDQGTWFSPMRKSHGQHKSIINLLLIQGCFPKRWLVFVEWKCDRKMAMNFSIRRFMSTMRWRRSWRRLSLACLSAISIPKEVFLYLGFVLLVMFYGLPRVSSPSFTPIWECYFWNFCPRIGHTNPRYSFLPFSNCSDIGDAPRPAIEARQASSPILHLYLGLKKTGGFFIDVPYQTGPKNQLYMGLGKTPTSSFIVLLNPQENPFVFDRLQGLVHSTYTGDVNCDLAIGRNKVKVV